MYFASLAELWFMDGDGPYVWCAYLIALMVLLLLIRASLVRRRAVLGRVRARMQACARVPAGE